MLARRPKQTNRRVQSARTLGDEGELGVLRAGHDLPLHLLEGGDVRETILFDKLQTTKRRNVPVTQRHAAERRLQPCDNGGLRLFDFRGKKGEDGEVAEHGGVERPDPELLQAVRDVLASHAFVLLFRLRAPLRDESCESSTKAKVPYVLLESALERVWRRVAGSGRSRARELQCRRRGRL